VVVVFNYLQRYGFWLNKGSSFTLIYNVKDSWEDSLVLAIVRGEKAVIFFEFVSFNHGTHAQCWLIVKL